MREVIEAVVAAEGEAKGIVAAASEEAVGIVAAARQAAGSLSASAHSDAHREVRESIESTVEAANVEKRRRLELASAEVSRVLRLDSKAMDSLVDAAVASIAGHR